MQIKLNKRGFTLAEVMVAITILAIVITLIHMTFSRTLASKEAVEADNDMFHAGRIIIERLAIEFANAYVKEPIIITDPDNPDESKVIENNTLFIGKHRDAGQYSIDSVNFTTLSNFVIGNEKESDLVQVIYYVSEEDGVQSLKRREYKIPQGVIDIKGDKCSFKDRCSEYTVVDNILGFEILYYDNERFGDKFSKKEWNSKSSDEDQYSRVPRALEIRIILPSSSGNPLIFKSIITIPQGYRENLDEIEE